MSKQIINSAFLAEQIAGSCRMEGIQVSKAQEDKMQQVISGQADPKKMLAELLSRYRQTK